MEECLELGFFCVPTIVLNTQKVFQRHFFFFRPAFSKLCQHAIMNKKLYKRLEYILYKIYKSIFAKMCPWPKQPRKGGQNEQGLNKFEYSNQNKIWHYSNIYKFYIVMHDKQMLDIPTIFEMSCKFVSKVIASTRLRNSWRLLFYVTIGILLLWFLDICVIFSHCIFLTWLWIICLMLCVLVC